ncbi:ubiquitin carboxyl-terminal hydrolase [Periconia macrospinosa]|uniref:Ubiquitin carboxyl-terminal hydrolase n=1 Tax=Periconia macrospinosa TaxID=97972 RepID=A0A2V1D9M0_9PLEO|nr:ubiquitin carboxyl-terminal hydrolase [Periconia macrospinosa]
MASNSAARESRYRKYVIPLESNPSVFDELIHRLGVTSLRFEDVYTLDDPQLLRQLIPRTHAFILVIPTTQAYEKEVKEHDKDLDEYRGYGDCEDVVYFKQTIYNACGLYAILHGLCNGSARECLGQENTLTKLLARSIPLPPEERALALESDGALEEAYTAVASKGETQAPEPEDEVDYHYICFVQSHKTGHLFQLDGDRKRPIDLGLLNDENGLLSDACLAVLREMVSRDEGAQLGVNLMALVSDPFI